MNNLTTPDPANLLAPPPSTPCVPPELQLALADRNFVYDGSPAWTPEHAHRVIESKSSVEVAKATLGDLLESTAPVPREWLGDRLTILWTMFMVSRTGTDAGALAIWLAEHMRFLGDLPHDIVAVAIDRSVQSARHGFIPSIGEIRAIAEPLFAGRARMIERLTLIVEGAA